MIDTHCHILDISFEGDREEVIQRTFEAGISKIIEIGVEPGAWQDTIDLCKKYENIFCAIGVHPNDADGYSDLTNFLKEEKVVAVGECGLDYFRNTCPKEIQMQVFEKQLDIAEANKKPVVIHSRKADDDVYVILRNHKNVRGVIHCFSSKLEYAEDFIKLGYYLGIDGPVTYPNANILREVVKNIPIERLLLETDSPYLPPQSFRGKRNEPSYVKLVAEEVAKIKEIPVEEVSRITDNNAKELFGI